MRPRLAYLRSQCVTLEYGRSFRTKYLPDELRGGAGKNRCFADFMIGVLFVIVLPEDCFSVRELGAGFC